jgi:hypothetical protein
MSLVLGPLRQQQPPHRQYYAHRQYWQQGHHLNLLEMSLGIR